MQDETQRLLVDNETLTCKSCATINFANLGSDSETLIVCHDLSQPLTDRNCPTCQVLQTAIDLHRSQHAFVNVSWYPVIPRSGFLGRITFQYSAGHADGYAFRTLKPDLMVFDDTAGPRRLKTQHAPRRVDFERAKTWIDACKKSHPDCSAHFPKVLKSLRVIDCVTRHVIPAPQDCVYVALSYVWGTSGTRDAPSSSALLDQLPLTVDNSIDAALMLGYRYLWVDKYVGQLRAVFGGLRLT